MIDSYFPDVAGSTNDYTYVDSSTRRAVQWPLAISWPAHSGSLDPNVLLTDDETQYFVYSGGLNSTAVIMNRTERIGSVSLNILSGSGISLGVLIGESLNDPVPNFYGVPYTTSGTAERTDLYFPTKYDDAPIAYTELLFPIAGTGQINVVLPLPVFNRAFTIVHSGVGTYSISQILPRKATGAFDLEVNAIKAYHVSADFIDTIALQVSESIVVSPDIPDKSITGTKILDGTVSGVLITPGTITSNEIAAGSITGNRITASTISGSLIAGNTITFDKLASKTLTAGQIADSTLTGAQIVAGTISGVLIADNTLTASKIQAGTITGGQIAANTISGALITAGTITSDKLQVDQLDAIAANMGTLVVNSGISIGDNGRLYVGSGEYTILNASGLAFKNPVTVAPPGYRGQSGTDVISNVQQYPPDVNSIKFASYYYDATTLISGAYVPVYYDYATPRYSTIIGQQQYYRPGFTVDGGNDNTTSIDSGWLPSESGRQYFLSTATNRLYLNSKSTVGSSLLLSTASSAASGLISMFNNKITVSGNGLEPKLTLAIPTSVNSANFVVNKIVGDAPFTFESPLLTVTSETVLADVPVKFSNTISGLAPQPNLLSNGAFINNSQSGYGALPDDWFQDNFTELLGGAFITTDYAGIKELENNFIMRGNWYLNEASGNALDYSGTSKTATQTGTVTRSRKSPMAYSPTFDGTANYFTYTDSSQVMNNANGFVVSAVVQATAPPTSGSNQQSFCGFYDSDNNETTVGVQGNNGYSYFYFQLRLPSGQGVITLTHPHLVQTGKWYHVVAQYIKDPGINRLVLWVNGTKAYVDNGATSRASTTSNVFGIGCAGNGNQRFSGRVNALTWWSDKGVNYLSTRAVRQMFAKLIYANLKVVPLGTGTSMIFQDVTARNLNDFAGKHVRFSAEVYLESSSNTAYCSIETNVGTTSGTATTTTGQWVQISTVVYVNSTETSLKCQVCFTGSSNSIWVRNCYAMVVNEKALEQNSAGVTWSSLFNAVYDHSKEDWRRFPKLLTLDYPIFHYIPYLFEENRWYDISSLLQISGGNSAVTTNVTFMWAGNQVSFSAGLLQLTSTQTYFWVYPPIRHSIFFETYSAAHCNVIIAGTAQADIGFIRFVPANDYWALYSRFNLLTWSNTGNKAVRIPFFTYRCDTVEEVE
jgi:hypothetical protein